MPPVLVKLWWDFDNRSDQGAELVSTSIDQDRRSEPRTPGVTSSILWELN